MVRGLTLWSCCLVAGCGRIAFDPIGDGGGGAGDDANDAALAPCTQWSPFAAPTHVTGLGAIWTSTRTCLAR